MERRARGYWQLTVPGIAGGARYLYALDNGLVRSDPGSHFQPEGVHGPSEVVDPREFRWHDQGWGGFDLEQAVLYEIHTGTFTPEGSFTAVIPRLKELSELGITAIELMPVAQFSGSRNWGYDGTFPYAAQNSYGGPQGLKELVDACHAAGIGVVLDVVANHTGPEGSVFADFGPYFTNRCATPWGQSINFDGPWSDEVRGYFSRNVLYWFQYYHIDALRLDAIQFINDAGARHILREIVEKTKRLSSLCGRRLWLIAESDLNDVRVINPVEHGGYGLDSQWLDDFHHSAHTLLTHETIGYYADYGAMAHLAESLERGFVYAWKYSPFRQRHYGSSSAEQPSSRFVAFMQNHDQVGNRLFGERLSSLAPFEALKLAAGLLLSSPYIPLLFMGEEYAEEAPFLYFVDHGDRELLRAVAQGRKNEFSKFVWNEEPPVPHAEPTFTRSKLRWEARAKGKGKSMAAYYRELIRLRSSYKALAVTPGRGLKVLAVSEQDKTIIYSRGNRAAVALCLANFSDTARAVRVDCQAPGLRRAVDSADPRWQGAGPTAPDILNGETCLVTLQPYNFVLYSNEAGDE